LQVIALPTLLPAFDSAAMEMLGIGVEEARV
jgi:hypothetical protein